MTQNRWQVVLALGVGVGVGIGATLGRAVQNAPTPDAASTSEQRTLRKLDELDAQVRRLGAAYAARPVTVALAPDAGAVPQTASSAPQPAPSNGEQPLEREAPSSEQIAAGDRLVALADRLLQSGRVTPADRLALREAAAAADTERRDETMLALVRQANAQKLKPSEPGPLF